MLVVAPKHFITDFYVYLCVWEGMGGKIYLTDPLIVIKDKNFMTSKMQQTKLHWRILYFSYCKQIPWNYPNQQIIDLFTSIVCIYKANITFLLAVDLSCCPTTIKNTSVSRTVALSNMFLCPEHYGHVNLFQNGTKQ